MWSSSDEELAALDAASDLRATDYPYGDWRWTSATGTWPVARA